MTRGGGAGHQLVCSSECTRPAPPWQARLSLYLTAGRPALRRAPPSPADDALKGIRRPPWAPWGVTRGAGVCRGQGACRGASTTKASPEWGALSREWWEGVEESRSRRRTLLAPCRGSRAGPGPAVGQACGPGRPGRRCRARAGLVWFGQRFRPAPA